MSQNLPGLSPPVDSVATMQQGSRQRVLVLKVVLLVFFLIVVARLVQIQVFDSSRYKEIARRQYEVKVDLPAARGNIYDRSDNMLVSNSVCVSFAADPKQIQEYAGEVADRFASVFERPRQSYLEKLSTKGTRFVWLERRVKPDYSRMIRADQYEGLIELGEPRRLYHFDHVGGQMIGFTDIDNNGLSGIEFQFDRYLKGINGFVVMQKDGLGRRHPSVDYPRVEPVNGKNVQLTIDIEYQAIVEEELKKGIERNMAESGLVVMMDPSTGEVLAMANYPPLNPNDAANVDQALMKNRSITDLFEPGSVFKVVTASAALEHNLVKPEQKFFAEHGSYAVRLPGQKKPRIITDTHKYGTLTFQEAIELSSNIVMAKVSDKIGAELMYTMARSYGFGTETGIELPGEIRGELKNPTEWSGTTLNTMAYGYEVGVTPLQIVAAYAAVANKGVLMKPFIVRQVQDEHGQVIAMTQPQKIRTVISRSTALTLTRFFEGAVQRGTGISARIPGIAIAGKTGTSRKFIDGRYETGNYTASFVGYFPAEDPKVVCLVMLDHPRVGGYTGGLVSAPIFRGIAQKIHSMSGRFARKQFAAVAGDHLTAVPDVTGLQANAAKTMLVARGLEVDIRGNGTVIRSQSPRSGLLLPRGNVVTLTTIESPPSAMPGYTIVPDVRGLPMRRAINTLTAQHLETGLTGSGIAVSQSPAPGVQVKLGARIFIRCEPKNLSMVNL